MQKRQTTLAYRGKKYPFYRTNRALMNFQNAGYTQEQLKEGNLEALLAFIYYTLIDCARRAGTPISDDFDMFIDESDDTTLAVFTQLNEAGEVPETPTPEAQTAASSASMSKSE